MQTISNVRRVLQHSGSRTRPAVCRRQGAVTLELILTLPIFLILFLAMVEFALFFANMQQVALACRVGAEEASQTDLTLTSDGDPVPANVVTAITQQLGSSFITPCELILEHNVQGAEQTLTTTLSPCDCSPPASSLPAFAARSVRMTICVPLTELTPNCLFKCGFDLSGKVAVCSTTFRYELSMP